MRRLVSWKHALIVMVLALLVVSIASELTGRAAPYWHYDLRQLYREQATFYRQIYPHADVALPTAHIEGVRSDYPPSSFCLFLPLLPPSLGFRSTEIWFTVVQIAAMFILGAFAWKSGQGSSAGLSVLLTASVLAITGLRADFVFGNVALITSALLVGLVCAAEANRCWMAAMFWAAVMIKPQIGWVFAVLFLHRNGWKPLLTASVFLGALALIACLWTGIRPLEFATTNGMENWWSIIRVSERYSLVTLLASVGVDPRVALFAGAALGSIIATWAVIRPLARSSSLQRFAFVALVNRICMYHNVCDDLLIAFALIWIGRRAGQTNRWTDWAIFLVLGITVWLPTTALHLPIARVAVVLTWGAVAGWLALAADEPRGSHGEIGAQAASAQPA